MIFGKVHVFWKVSMVVRQGSIVTTLSKRFPYIAYRLAAPPLFVHVLNIWARVQADARPKGHHEWHACKGNTAVCWGVGGVD